MLFKKILRIVKANMVSKGPTEPFTYQDDNWQESETKREKNSSVPPVPDAKETLHYQALEVPYSASFGEIKISYKKLVKKYHPDRFHHDPEKSQYAKVVTQKLNEAFAYFEKKYEGKM